MKNKLYVAAALLLALSGCARGGQGDSLKISSEAVSPSLPEPAPESGLASGSGYSESVQPSLEFSLGESEPAKETEPETFQSLLAETSRLPSSAEAPEASEQSHEPREGGQSSLNAAAPPSDPGAASEASSLGERNYLSDIELEVIALINAERSACGLGEIAYDPSLAKAARIRSAEMFSGDFFAHARKNGEEWETVLKKDVPVKYKAAGENLAMVEHNMSSNDPARDAAYWYETWEKSPSHYENMIRPEFTHAGVGIYYGMREGLKTAVATTIFASF